MKYKNLALIFVLFAFITFAEPCDTPALDPSPFPLLSDSIFEAILNGNVDWGPTPAGFRITATYTNGTFNLSPDYPEDTTFASDNIKKVLGGWGYNVTVSFGVPLKNGTITFNGDSSVLPIFRVFLLDLGVRKDNATRAVQFKDWYLSQSWDTPDVTGVPRIAIFNISSVPANTFGVAKNITQWFCERNVDVTSSYTGLLSDTPKLVSVEVITDIDECALGSHSCELECLDGRIPANGYSCLRADGSSFAVDQAGLSLFSAEKVIWATKDFQVEKWRDVKTFQNNDTKIYVMTITPALNQSAFDSINGEVVSIIGALLPGINPGRIEFGFTNETLTIFVNQASSVIIECQATSSGNLASLTAAVQNLTGLTEPALDVNEDETNRKVFFTFNENGTLIDDPQYLALGCNFFGNLSLPDVQNTLNGGNYAIDFSSCTSPSCSATPTPTPTPRPTPTPVPTTPVTPVPTPTPVPTTPVTPTPTPTPDPMTPTPTDTPSSPGNNNQTPNATNNQGLIIGLSVAGAIILIFIIVAIIFFVMKKKKNSDDEKL